MEDSAVEAEVRAAQELAERLARRAWWSVGCGAVGFGLAGFVSLAVPLVLFRVLDLRSITPILLLYLAIPPIFFLLAGGIPATILGARAVRQSNTINRPLGVLGLVLGIVCLGAAGLRLARSVMTFVVLNF